MTSRVDPVIGPLHDIPLVRPFTVEWTGQLYAPKSGRYLLGIQQSDSGELVVDGRVIEQNARPNTLVERPLHLTRGWHDLRLRWIHRSQHPRVYFSWSPPGRPTSIVPSRFLRPPPGPHPPGGEGRRLPRLDESSAAPGDAAP